MPYRKWLRKIAQFVIVTLSPMLLKYPNAPIPGQDGSAAPESEG